MSDQIYTPPQNEATHEALMESLERKFKRTDTSHVIREAVRELYDTIKEDSIRDQVSSQLDILTAKESKIGVELSLFQSQQQLSRTRRLFGRIYSRNRRELSESESKRKTLKKGADNMANVLMKCSDEIITLRAEKQALLAEKQELLAEKQELLTEKQELLADNKAQKKRVASLEKKKQQEDDEIQIIEDDEIQIIEPPVRSSS